MTVEEALQKVLNSDLMMFDDDGANTARSLSKKGSVPERTQVAEPSKSAKE